MQASRQKLQGKQSESLVCSETAHVEGRIHRQGWTGGEAARVGWAVTGFGHKARCVWGSPFWQGIQLQGPSGGPLERG